MNDCSAPWAKEARPCSSGTMGKCDRRLDLVIPEELESAIIAMSALNNMSKGEFSRKVLEKAMFGEFSMMQKIAQTHR